MRSSLVKQLVIHCSLLLIKTSDTYERHEKIMRMDDEPKILEVREDPFDKFIKENMKPELYNLYDIIQLNPGKLTDGSLTIKKWSRDGEHNLFGMPPKIDDFLIATFQQRLSNENGISSDEQILLRIMNRSRKRFAIDLCNHILFLFRKLDVNDDIMTTITENVTEIFNALGSVNERINLDAVKYNLFPPPCSYFRPKDMHKELDRNQETLDDLFLEQGAPILFTIKSYLQLFMEVSSKTNSINIAIYRELITAYNVLEKVSCIIFKFPIIMKKEYGYSGPVGNFYREYHSFIIPTLQSLESQFNRLGQENKIKKMFEEVRELSSINDFRLDISKDMKEIFTELNTKNQFQSGWIKFEDELRSLTKWLVFLSYEENSSTNTTEN